MTAELTTESTRFAGRRIVVTGAASGMGGAVAQAMARGGARVFAVDRDRDGLQALASGVEGIATHVADLSDASAIRDYAKAAKALLGDIDGLFNNAGIAGFYESIPTLSEEQWRTAMAINLDAPFLALKHLVPAMTDGAAVVNTASTLGLVAAADRVDYVVSKHAVVGLTRAAAVELAPRGIRVNCICPGPIDTPMMAAYESLLDSERPDLQRQRLEDEIPVGRYGALSEIVRLVTFLLEPGLGYLTGAVISVDGAFVAT